MSDLHTFKIKTGISPHDAVVEMDGKPISGLTRLSFEMKAGAGTVLKLEMFGEILIEGEFRENEIFTIARIQE
jgi:membrane-associated protease RseP (regulator of RpoE activity)